MAVSRRRQPVVAVMSIRRFQGSEEAAADLALVLARLATDTGERIPLDDVLAAFGHTRESLAAVPGEA
ncbi:hypothetical protein GCM10009560_13290 [Nonomuraea longicatena]|uniref:Uncharacterized protein n=2 Tax=Nonomuraea longicatena TaxID=83682 RepID=A0ABP3Z8H4_9ACTN